MKLIAEQSVLRGAVRIPGSKSHTIRSVALAALAEGTSNIHCPLVSSDTRSALRCYGQLGARIDARQDLWTIEGTAGKLSVPENVIDAGNSGTTLRFGVASAALLTGGAAVFTGDHQIRSRPLGPLLRSLNELGADCFSTLDNDRAPVVVRGTLRGGRTEIQAVTSQYLSALLINTPLAANDTSIHVTVLNEAPYIEMTLNYLQQQNIEFQQERFDTFHIKGGQSYRAFERTVPADFSSATFFLCAGAILDAQITLQGLDFSDTQGDKEVVNILRRMGAEIRVSGSEVTVSGGDLQGMEIDMNAIPDALPALAVTACFASGKTRLFNVPQARLKETDRIAVMACELAKMGANVQEQPDGLIIQPGPLRPANLSGCHDHRIVMALSLAGMALPGTTSIDTAQAVAVTFPNYVELMQSLGANLSIVQRDSAPDMGAK